jgi:hypothetical protein
MWRVLLFWRWPWAITSTLWHNRECRKMQPTWSWAHRQKANWWFFVMCMHGLIVPGDYFRRRTDR